MKDLETNIVTDLKEMYGLREQLGNEIAGAIASGDTAKALELKEVLVRKIHEAEQKLDPYDLKFRQELAKEFGYSYVGMFSPEGIARTKLRSLWNYINRKGDLLFPDSALNSAGPFIEGLGLFKRNPGMFFVNSSGKIMGPYDEANDFSEGLATVRKQGWSYFINKNGQIISDAFFGAQSFKEGLAPIKIQPSNWVFINKRQICAFSEKYSYAQPFSSGLALIRELGDKQYFNFIDTSGQIQISEKFKMAEPFSEDLAAVQQRGSLLKGYINVHGRFVIAEQFNLTTPFSEGLALVTTEDFKYVFINKKGDVVLDSDLVDEFTPFPFKEGVARIRITEDDKPKYSYMDHYGRRVFE